MTTKSFNQDDVLSDLDSINKELSELQRISNERWNTYFNESENIINRLSQLENPPIKK